jgi:hypothetical protein
MTGSRKIVVTGYVGEVGGFYVQECTNFTQALPGEKVSKDQLHIWITDGVTVQIKRKASK